MSREFSGGVLEEKQAMSLELILSRTLLSCVLHIDSHCMRCGRFHMETPDDRICREIDARLKNACVVDETQDHAEPP